MKTFKQILEAMLSESSGPKNNPYWGDATPVATVGIGKDGPKLIGTTRGAIKASRTAAAEGEQIIRDANRPKPGELVPLNRFDANGKLLPSRQKPEPSGKTVPPSRQKVIPSWMNQTPPRSPNSGQGTGRIRLPTAISTPPTSGNTLLPEPPPKKSGPSIFDPNPDEEAAWGEYKKRKGIKEKQLGPDAKLGDAGPMPGRERFEFQQEYLKTLTPEKRKAYDEMQNARRKEIGDAFTSFSRPSSKMIRY